MQKEITIVPTGKSPLDVLAEMGERTRNAWIFLDAKAVKNLESSADCIQEQFQDTQKLIWHATEEHPATSIEIDSLKRAWSAVYRICADDISFLFMPNDPEEILFLKMAE